MGILKRFKDIMTANINSLMEKAEGKNADKILEQYLREAKQDYEQVIAETAAVIADETAAARKISDLEEEIVKLGKYAEQAVLAGNEADARKFLEGKNKAVAQKADAEALYAQAKENSDRMRQMTKKLREDIAIADSKLGELKSKLAVAEQTEKMADLNEKLSPGTSFSSYESLADAVQKRIDTADAKAALKNELNEDYDIDTLKKKYTVQEASNGPTVDDELAALKAKLGK